MDKKQTTEVITGAVLAAVQKLPCLSNPAISGKRRSYQVNCEPSKVAVAVEAAEWAKLGSCQMHGACRVRPCVEISLWLKQMQRGVTARTQRRYL